MVKKKQLGGASKLLRNTKEQPTGTCYSRHESPENDTGVEGMGGANPNGLILHGSI